MTSSIGCLIIQILASDSVWKEAFPVAGHLGKVIALYNFPSGAQFECIASRRRIE